MRGLKARASQRIQKQLFSFATMLNVFEVLLIWTVLFQT